jgi:hypothetical protein
MTTQFVQNLIYRNLVQRPVVSRALDSFGDKVNRLGFGYATGAARAKAVIFASQNQEEVSVPGLYKYAGISFNDRLMSKAMEMTKLAVEKRLAAGKLTSVEAELITAQLNDPSVREYLCGFEFQSLVEVPLAIPGILTFLSLGAGEFKWSLAFGLFDVVTNEAYILWRVIKNWDKGIPMGWAALLNLNPYFGGIFAYPVQMYFADKQLARFLFSEILSKTKQQTLEIIHKLGIGK